MAEECQVQEGVVLHQRPLTLFVFIFLRQVRIDITDVENGQIEDLGGRGGGGNQHILHHLLGLPRQASWEAQVAKLVSHCCAHYVPCLNEIHLSYPFAELG